jgi:hypothetical protein
MLRARDAGNDDRDREGGSVMEAKNHLPSLPARANQEAAVVPTPRYGRGNDLEVILEVLTASQRSSLALAEGKVRTEK